MYIYSARKLKGQKLVTLGVGVTVTQWTQRTAALHVGSGPTSSLVIHSFIHSFLYCNKCQTHSPLHRL